MKLFGVFDPSLFFFSLFSPNNIKQTPSDMTDGSYIHIDTMETDESILELVKKNRKLEKHKGQWNYEMTVVS